VVKRSLGLAHGIAGDMSIHASSVATVTVLQHTCVLADGRYEVIVIDAVRRDDGTIALDLTITTGEHKGEVVSVVATGIDGGEFDLLAMPGALTVENDVPRFVLDE
jgi:hypothetical protein